MFTIQTLGFGVLRFGIGLGLRLQGFGAWGLGSGLCRQTQRAA